VVDIATAEAGEALDRLPSGLPLVVAGYSFGAGIATQLLDAGVVKWVLVAFLLRAAKLETDAIAAARGRSWFWRPPTTRTALHPKRRRNGRLDGERASNPWKAPITSSGIDGAGGGRAVEFIRAR
jgi:hypothetical protein